MSKLDKIMSTAVVTLFIITVAWKGLKTTSYAAAQQYYNKYYTVVSVSENDTIGSIYYNAIELYPDTVNGYNLNSFVKEVCSINHLVDPDYIRNGQKLTVPYLNGLKEEGSE